MKKIKNNTRLMFVSLVVFSALIGIICISASDVNSSNIATVLDGNNNFVMMAPYNTETGYHWEINPETHGTYLVSQDLILNHPNTCGSSATACFNFRVNSDDYYAKLVLISSSGNIVDEI